MITCLSNWHKGFVLFSKLDDINTSYKYGMRTIKFHKFLKFRCKMYFRRMKVVRHINTDTSQSSELVRVRIKVGVASITRNI